MGLFSFLKSTDMDEAMQKARETEGAIIVDVRSESEFAGGHIKGAKNVPLGQIEKISKVTSDMAAPLFVYCASGNRSSSAVRKLKSMGYAYAENLGGLSSYSGPLVKGRK